jgi:prephenate dehydrogenase
MSSNPDQAAHSPVGIIGFGAFGQFMARQLCRHFRIMAFDVEADTARANALGVSVVPFETVASCPIVILACPVGQMHDVVGRLAPLLKPGAIVVDVGSVKIEPARIMRELLPADVEIVATHPLFGPQSARDGIRGHRIAICPIRGRRFRVAAVCRKLGLDVIMTTPEEHDRDIAQVQGITHLVASVLVRMDLKPTRMTTQSFERLMSAIDMVRHDAPEVFQAILRGNPYAGDVLTRFKSIASALDQPS